MAILKMSVSNTLSLSVAAIAFRRYKLFEQPFYKYSGIMLCFTAIVYLSSGSEFSSIKGSKRFS